METLENILAHVAAKGGSRTVLIEIYLKEQMFDAALEEVMAYDIIQRLKFYHKKICIQTNISRHIGN